MIKHFAEGEIIISEGDSSNCAFILDEGRVEVLKDRDGIQKVRLAVLEEGELFGEMGLVDNSPRSATVRALSPCTVTLLTGEDFEVFLQNDPKALAQILSVYCKRLRSTLQIIGSFQDFRKAVAV